MDTSLSTFTLLGSIEQIFPVPIAYSVFQYKQVATSKISAEQT